MDFDTARILTVWHNSPGQFLAVCAPWLSLDEAVNHGLLSLADALATNKHIHTPPFYCGHVEYETGRQIGACLYAEPDGLVLSEMPLDAADLLFADLGKRLKYPSRVFGPEVPAMHIATLFGKRNGSRPTVHSIWNIHRLDSLPTLSGNNVGTIRLGGTGDLDLVSDWGKKYDSEKPANVNIETFLMRKLGDGLLYFLVDDEPKTLLTLSGTNCAGTRISSVYTPVNHRAQGYASALVREICNKLIANGQSYVTLNTELGDPAERIYKKLGFVQIGQRVSIVFDRTS